jgi:ABC-type anion transport system duplicated permease subunit
VSIARLHRRYTRRLRRHATGLLLVLATGAAISAHHSGLGMGDMHPDGMGSAIEMCLGAFTAVGAAVIAVAVGVLALGRWLIRPSLVSPVGFVLAGNVTPRHTRDPRASIVCASGDAESVAAAASPARL